MYKREERIDYVSLCGKQPDFYIYPFVMETRQRDRHGKQTFPLISQWQSFGLGSHARTLHWAFQMNHPFPRYIHKCIYHPLFSTKILPLVAPSTPWQRNGSGVLWNNRQQQIELHIAKSIMSSAAWMKRKSQNKTCHETTRVVFSLAKSCHWHKNSSSCITWIWFIMQCSIKRVIAK